LGVDWISTFPQLLRAATVDDVSAAAARFFAPSGFTSLVVGDATTITAGLATLVPIES
ncbi:MAG: hypothetical protein QOH89_2648, partial [Pseudonocardiales bacterium]|nr:hypothetical protein [Pseudonocardiales bacterium]